MNADDAYARIRAGASLVQVYTGFIYGGPRFSARPAARTLSSAPRATASDAWAMRWGSTPPVEARPGAGLHLP